VVNTSLYLVVGYVLIDFLVRNFAPVAALAGVWDELLFIGIVGLWMLYTGLERRSIRGTRLLVPVLVYLAVMVFLLLIKSPEMNVAVEGLRVMVQYVFWFFVAANLVSSKSQVKWLADLFLLAGLVVALYGVYQYFTGVEMPSTWIDAKMETSIKTRVFSIVGSPNVLGSLMILGLPVAFVSYVGTEKAVKKLFYLLAAGAMGMCLVFTFSRGAWLAVLAATILLGLWRDKRILAGMVVLALLTPVLMPSVYQRVAYMTTPEFTKSSQKGGRLGRWDQALSYWRGAPLTGVGLGRFGGAVAARHFPEDSFYVDNFYLKVSTETGLLGILALVFLLLCGLNLARRSLDEVDDEELHTLGLGILAGLVGVLVHNGVENIFEVPMMSTYFWFFLGVLAALPWVARGTGDLPYGED